MSREQLQAQHEQAVFEKYLHLEEFKTTRRFAVDTQLRQMGVELEALGLSPEAQEDVLHYMGGLLSLIPQLCPQFRLKSQMHFPFPKSNSTLPAFQTKKLKGICMKK